MFDFFHKKKYIREIRVLVDLLLIFHLIPLKLTGKSVESV